MRVLWVTAEAPDFRLGGGAIRQAHLLAGLSRAADRVDLLSSAEVTDPAVRDLVGRVTEIPVPRPRPHRTAVGRRVSDLYRAGVARTPAEAYDRRQERDALATVLGRMARAAADARPSRRVPGPARPAAPPYDVVHAEHLGLAGIIPAGVGRLVSLGVQNVPSRMATQARALQGGRRQRLLLAAEAANARRFEAAAVRGTDILAVVSSQDAGDLGAVAGAGAARPHVLVVPNGVEVPDDLPGPLPAEPRLVFTGTLDYLPNVDGITWFADEVLPLVQRDLPGATLAVVGRRPVPAVAALGGRPGIRVHADVPDVEPFLAAARVAVVPVRIGTGSRLKALEAMAAGRPVAATATALEGLEVERGRHALVADRPDALAAAVVRLCREDAEATRLAGAGRELAATRYRWDRIADGFARSLGGLVTMMGERSWQS